LCRYVCTIIEFHLQVGFNSDNIRTDLVCIKDRGNLRSTAKDVQLNVKVNLKIKLDILSCAPQVSIILGFASWFLSTE